MRQQPKRPSAARPHLRTVARTRTLDAGFLLGVQQPDAKAQLAELADVSLETLVDEGVDDLRDLPWLSIDEASSRDLDQVSVADALADDTTRLRVGVADVDAWIPLDSPLDRHAARNAVSVFTGVATYPMLPDALAKHISFDPDEDRLAVVVDLTIAANGSLRDQRVCRALVRNHARLDYEQAEGWLEEQDAAPTEATIMQQLRLHERAALALRERRLQAGALDLRRDEFRPVFAEDWIADIVVVPPNRARLMIEELMLTANAAFARFASSCGVPWIARTQAVRDWEDVREFAQEWGYDLPATTGRTTFNALVQHFRTLDAGEAGQLHSRLARLLGGTEDRVVEEHEAAPPHYSLALDGYTRATAPLRRYGDLVMQRIVKACIARQPPPYTSAALEGWSEHSRERARAAEGVERSMLRTYGALLLGERTNQVFDATVTATNDYGVWARLDRPPVEGRLAQGAADLDRGDRLRVRVTRTDWERGYVDLARLA